MIAEKKERCRSARLKSRIFLTPCPEAIFGKIRVVAVCAFIELGYVVGYKLCTANQGPFFESLACADYKTSS